MSNSNLIALQQQYAETRAEIDRLFEKSHKLRKEIESTPDGYSYFIEFQSKLENKWKRAANAFEASDAIFVAKTLNFPKFDIRILTDNENFSTQYSDVRVQLKTNHEMQEVERSLGIMEYI